MIFSQLFAPFGKRVKASYANTRTRLRYSSKNVRLSSFVELADVEFSSYVNVAHHAQISNCVIGKRSSIGRYTKIRDAVIGSYCSISWDVSIGAVSHPMEHPSSHAFWYRKQFGIVSEDTMMDSRTVTIGNDVWIGCNSVIMPGVTIGDGAVIGASSVVTKDVLPYSVVAGAPAKEVRMRFPADLEEGLLLLQWWNWDDEKIKSERAFFERPLTLESIKRVEGRL